uniref:Kinesin motor domain-containing protein n=1 Tax=Globodera pallida TaxID=36090 RepID=A0A183CQW5_GLOPA
MGYVLNVRDFCEKVRDLLSANLSFNKGRIKVRKHPKNGFYVEGLSSWPVGSYRKVAKLFNEGTRARTIAVTVSSRAHTIVRIEFTQNYGKPHSMRTSEINLVDLAGANDSKGRQMMERG